MTDPDPRWADLQAPFTGDEVGKLPKGKGRGEDVNCPVCGSRHKAEGIIHVDYVGHAHITKRLNAVDPTWVLTPAPIVVDVDGMAYMVCSLTVLGVTKWEVGCADTDKDEWPKLLFSDCLTRCAMRFGLATDLWVKSGPGGEVNQDRTRRAPARAATTSSRRPQATAGQTAGPPVATLLDGLKASVGDLGDGGRAEWADWKAEHDWDRKYLTRALNNDRELVEAAGRFVRDLIANERAAAGDEPFGPVIETREVPDRPLQDPGDGDYDYGY